MSSPLRRRREAPTPTGIPSPDASGSAPLEALVETVWEEATRTPWVLLVIWDGALRTLCRAPLLAELYGVSEADTAAAAVDLARLSPPDVVVLDLRSMRDGGWWALARLREEPRTAQVPVVGLVDALGESEIWYARRYGVRFLVCVPIDPEQLLEAVASILEEP